MARYDCGQVERDEITSTPDAYAQTLAKQRQARIDLWRTASGRLWWFEAGDDLTSRGWTLLATAEPNG